MPAGITALSPVNRSTARFGIAITFQAADFKKAASLATFAANPTPPAAGAPAATPPPAPPPPKATAATPEEKEKAKAAVAAAELDLKNFTALRLDAKKVEDDLTSSVATAEAALAAAAAAEKPDTQKIVDGLRVDLGKAKTAHAAARAGLAVAQKTLDAAKTILVGLN